MEESESESELERERERSNAALAAWQQAGSQAKALKASLELQRRKSVQLSSLAEEATGRLEVTQCTLLADVREMEEAHADTRAMLEAVRNVSRHTCPHTAALARWDARRLASAQARMPCGVAGGHRTGGGAEARAGGARLRAAESAGLQHHRAVPGAHPRARAGTRRDARRAASCRGEVPRRERACAQGGATGCDRGREARAGGAATGARAGGAPGAGGAPRRGAAGARRHARHAHATRTPRTRHASTPRMCLRTTTLCTTTLCAAAGAARGRGTGAAQCDGRGEARAGAGTRRGRTAGGGT
eukprot:scaffold52462_cov71-Phaeocystis_antarctica.AAC.15